MAHLGYTPEKHGVIVHRMTKESVPLNSVLDLVCLWEHKGASGYLLRGTRQEVELRLTPSGQLRLGPVRKAGPVRAFDGERRTK